MYSDDAKIVRWYDNTGQKKPPINSVNKEV